MKTLFTLLFGILISNLVLSQTKADTLKNETIIKLTQSKLGDKLIINKINSSPVKFDISTDGLINLKKNGVTEAVLDAMIDIQSKIDLNKETNANNNSADGSYVFKKPGIYFKEGEKYIALDPTMVTSSTKRGYLSVTNMMQLEGNQANYDVNTSTELYFNFTPERKTLNDSKQTSTRNDYFDLIMGNASAISPNEFKLVHLKVKKSILPFIKKNKREYQSGKASVGKVDNTIGDRYIVNFKYEQVSEFTYKIILPSDIVPGQYCFIYLSNNSSSFYGKNSQKVFDFEIK